MKIFERNGKINFVDANNSLLGYDINQKCCERADWFISDSPQDTVNYPLEDKPTDKELESYRFDPTYFCLINNSDLFDEGGMAIFRIVNSVSNKPQEKFIHLINSHNGYYHHGFEFTQDNLTIQDGAL